MTHTGNDNRYVWFLAIIGIIIVSVLVLISFANAEQINPNSYIEFKETQLEIVKEITYQRAYEHSLNATNPNLLERQSFCVDVECVLINQVNQTQITTLETQLDKLERTMDFLHRTYASAILKENISGETLTRYQNAINSVTPNITNSSGFSYP